MVTKVTKFSDMVMKSQKVKVLEWGKKSPKVLTKICLRNEVQGDILVEFDPNGNADIWLKDRNYLTDHICKFASFNWGHVVAMIQN